MPKELFCNWLKPENDFVSYMDYPYTSKSDGLLRQETYWIETWGERPTNKQEKRKVIKEK